MNTALAISSLHQAAVPCSDLARSIAFYRDLLGLRFIAQFSPPGLAFFSLGETCACSWRRAPTQSRAAACCISASRTFTAQPPR
jgi:catechol 2,3-dioxygenase-like lactoylglutathione lyase family enzyme